MGMNKYEKAFNHLREHASFDTVDEMIDIKELVEKAIPKKPIKNEMGKISFLDKLFGTEDAYTCPNCGNALLKHYMNERQETRYCWDCGQAIDWRGEDGEA
jgi:predicted RNA-binding Zn-ribbon protein involved in translation (DUF1610 family)